MLFSPFEVTVPHIIYACLGGFIVLFGMFSLFLREKLYIGEACWAFVFGVIIGPYGANIFDPRGWTHGDEATSDVIALEFTRVVLAVGVFAIGVELPKAYMARHWKSLFFLLGPVMTWGWFISAAFIFALVPGLNFLSSLVVAACLTPTDPILAQAVVGGKYANKHVPAHIRHLLAAESGCNDGAAFPFLFIALYLILDHNTGEAIRDWFLLLWLYQVILGIVIGAALGMGFRYLMKFCQKRDLIDRHSYVAQYISLALLTIGVTTLLGSDDLLAAFSCGAAFAWDGFFNRQTEEAVFSSVIDLLFNIASFVFVGAWMPFGAFNDAELTLSVWRLVVIAILVLLFRRLPAMIALYRWIPDVKTFREALFSGHFGPMGIGAVFISTLAAERLHRDGDHDSAQVELLAKAIQPITAFMVLCSILVHGLSIPSFSLSRRIHTVSRTWSRHTTLGGANQPPEWTNQAKHINPGEEIAINRDPEKNDTANRMERGELSSIGKSNSGVSNSTSATDIRDRSQGSTEDLVVHSAGELPPDGEESVLEWDEGPHKVIERRKGPGEEVEVEVIRDYGSPHAHSFHFRGPRPSVQEHLAAYLARLKQLVHERGTEVRRRPGVALPDASTHTSVDTEAPPGAATRTDHESAILDDDDDEEGWASDQSGAGIHPSSTAQTHVDRDHTSRRGSGVRSSRPGSVSSVSKKGRSKRRASMRRGIMMNQTGATEPQSLPNQAQTQALDEGGSENARGRSSMQVSVQHRPSRSNSRHPLDGIRALHAHHAARELSPARYSSVFRYGSPGDSSVPGTPPPERTDNGA
ncbi:na+ h+ exchanger 1 [Moniliophthora roreri MCA 2997]|uniref:Na+ h+ exchanger 1 n=1 Tax=Moniliophthora roreri (strain MCA 2997) TaxID=1381753 RepID=V2XWF2_MONRO|nr:na+ h+ exchanger 1 [Moniliophthora roreri MCA 2997]